MANRVRDPQREQFWRDVLTRFHASGLSVRAFCRQEQLREPRFYAWRRTLAQRDRPAADQTGNQRPTHRRRSPVRPVKQPAFVPVVMRPASVALPASGIVLELGGRRVLHWPESMPIERLAALLQALEAACGELDSTELAEVSRAEARR